MDPNACLNEMRALAARILDGEGDAADGGRLAELVDALDGWLARGGFVPAAWVRR